MSNVNEVLPIEMLSAVLCEHLPRRWLGVAMYVCPLWREVAMSQWQQQRDDDDDEFSLPPLCVSACVSSVALLRWMLSIGPPFECKHKVSVMAAAGGHLEVLKWMDRQEPYKFPITLAVCTEAARNGHLNVLKWLRGSFPHHAPGTRTCALQLLPGAGWMCCSGYGSRTPLPLGRAVDEAIKHGRLDVLQWMGSLCPPCPINLDVVNAAAHACRIYILEWVQERNFDLVSTTHVVCNAAAGNGRLDVLRWAHSQNPPFPWGEGACNSAAMNGHLDVLRWLRAQVPPCPWGKDTCYHTAAGGHMDVLWWLRAQDPPCPWDSLQCCTLIAFRGKKFP